MLAEVTVLVMLGEPPAVLLFGIMEVGREGGGREISQFPSRVLSISHNIGCLVLLSRCITGTH